jgi:hypothetical protein
MNTTFFSFVPLTSDSFTSHGPTSQGKNIVVKAAKYSLENFEGGIITFICPNRILSVQIQVKKIEKLLVLLPSLLKDGSIGFWQCK